MLSEAEYRDLSTKGIFIVGSARSGTSIFCDCLNLSKNVYVLQEANLFLNHDQSNFMELFNTQHERFRNSRSKGTYIPSAVTPKNGENGIEFMARMGKQYRYIGEKVAFGVQSKLVGRTHQEIFFDFQAKYFYHSRYFLLIRRPSEVVWSMSKLWPELGIDSLIASWIKTIDISIDVYQSFPHAYVLFWEEFGSETVQKIGQLLDTEIAVPEGMINPEYNDSRLHEGEWPVRLTPCRQILEACDGVYAALKSSFSVSEFTYVRREEQRKFFRDIKREAARVLSLVELAGSDHSYTDAMKIDSGERLLPEIADVAQWGEHVSRYLFAADLVRGKTVLDAGCGAGYGANLLLEHGAAWVVGVDVSAEASAYARSHYPRPELEFCTMDLTRLAFPDKSFQVVVMLEVLEHISGQAQCLAEVRRVLKDDGVLVVSTPNQPEHPGELFNPFHVHELDRAELTSLLTQQFRDIQLFGFGFLAGSYVFPADFDRFEDLTVDPYFLQAQPHTEPPFLIAICSPSQLPALVYPHKVSPYSLDRLAYAGELARIQTPQNRLLASELVALCLARPAEFQARLVQVSPGILLALQDMIREFVQNRQYGPAASVLEPLLQEHPSLAEAHFLLANCLHLAQADLPGARMYYDQALERGFDEFWVRFYRGILLREMGELDASRADLEQALELRPADEAATQHLRETLKAVVRQAMQQSDFAAALTILESLSGGPADPEWYYLTAQCLHQLEMKPQHALAQYGLALELGFDEFWVRFYRGILLRDLRDLAASRIDLERAVELRPSDHSACQHLRETLKALARAAMERKDFAAALIILARFPDSQPADPEWHFLTAQCLQQEGQNPRAAVEQYDYALQYGYHEFSVRFQRGVLYLALNQRELARADFQRAATLDPLYADMEPYLKVLGVSAE